MTWTTSTVTDALVLLDDTWVRLSAVEAVKPTKAYAPPAALVYLTSGAQIHVAMSVDDVVDKLGAATKRPA
jgi:hypothetical protein